MDGLFAVAQLLGELQILALRRPAGTLIVVGAALLLSHWQLVAAAVMLLLLVLLLLLLLLLWLMFLLLLHFTIHFDAHLSDQRLAFLRLLASGVSGLQFVGFLAVSAASSVYLHLQTSVLLLFLLVLAGGQCDRRLSTQKYIPAALPNAGHIAIFENCALLIIKEILWY